MAGSQDKGLYDTLFSGSAEDLHARVRAEAFGEEIGQNSWLTADEHRHFFEWLELGPESEVLEVASGRVLVRPVLIPAGSFPEDLAVGDVNGDGLADVVDR